MFLLSAESDSTDPDFVQNLFETKNPEMFIFVVGPIGLKKTSVPKTVDPQNLLIQENPTKFISISKHCVLWSFCMSQASFFDDQGSPPF